MTPSRIQSPAAIAAQRSTDEQLPPLDRRVIVGLFSGRRRNLNMVVSETIAYSRPIIFIHIGEHTLNLGLLKLASSPMGRLMLSVLYALIAHILCHHLNNQIQYMNVLVARGLVHELHLWDFSTRRSTKNQNKEDIATMLKIKVCVLISHTYGNVQV
jgi:hypothetical protein